MYIANRNYLSAAGKVRRGDEVKNPSKQHIERGYVREAKVVKPETKDDRHNDKPERKPKAKAKRDQQPDVGPADQPGDEL